MPDAPVQRLTLGQRLSSTSLLTPQVATPRRPAARVVESEPIQQPDTPLPDADLPDAEAHDADAEADPPGAPVVPTFRSGARAAGLWLVEAVAAIGTAVLLTVWARHIVIDPFPREAQVSVLAHLQLQFWVLGGVAILVALATLRWRNHPIGALAARLACAMAAGLSTSMVAGAVVVGLNGTPWGLGSDNYDARNLASWAQIVSNGGAIPSGVYPPGFVYLLSWVSEITGQNTFYALKDLQILGAALLGPLAYLAWRAVLRPAWALGVGTVAALPLVDAYKPASSLSLALAIPVFVALIQVVRRSDRYRIPGLIGFGVLFGATLGALVLLHPMYLIWPAPGVLVAILLLTPWRKAWWRAGLLLAVSLLAFAVVCGQYLYRFLTEAGDTKENFVYFDALQDPAYFLMWRGGSPGNVGQWPPPGELGGVGLFAIVLVLGIGIALALGYKRSLVVTVLCCFGSVWAFRLYDAARMYHLQQVRLWPRTSLALIYFTLLLTGAAVLVASRALKNRRVELNQSAAILGCVVAALLVFGMAGSSTADKYLPHPAGQAGYLTYLSQATPALDGKCGHWTYAKTMKKGTVRCIPKPTPKPTP